MQDSIFPYWVDGEPVLSHQDNVFLIAVGLGCWPESVGFGWRCLCKMHCREHAHAISPTDPAITWESLRRFKAEGES